MYKFTCLFLLFCVFACGVNAAPDNQRDSMLRILDIRNPHLREKQLVAYLRNHFSEVPTNQLTAAKTGIERLLQHSGMAESVAIASFVNALYQARLGQFNTAENILIRTIVLAEKNENDYLLYACFTHLGFIQTYQGNITEAISNFRMAKKEAALLDDAYLQVVIDINISDIYYKINLCSQALFYLGQAQTLMADNHINIPKTRNAIINNIAECYFRMGNADSLQKYNRILHHTTTGMAALYVYQQRTDYYMDLLRHDYPAAISRMQRLSSDKHFGFGADDEQNLADAYYQAGQPDSAKKIIRHLLGGEAQNNHPEIKMHLFEVLGQIAEKEQDTGQTAYYKMALQQAKEQIGRLTHVDTIASQMKIDEMQGAYIQKTEKYQRERLWMGFTIIVTLMGLVIAALSYLNVKRRKYYEQLLFDAQKEELAFINSHEVRRHLSNILGIIDTIKQSDDRHLAYIEAEDHLLKAAANLDAAIRNISAKLEK